MHNANLSIYCGIYCENISFKHISKTVYLLNFLSLSFFLSLPTLIDFMELEMLSDLLH